MVNPAGMDPNQSSYTGQSVQSGRTPQAKKTAQLSALTTVKAGVGRGMNSMGVRSEGNAIVITLGPGADLATCQMVAEYLSQNLKGLEMPPGVAPVFIYSSDENATTVRMNFVDFSDPRDPQVISPPENTKQKVTSRVGEMPVPRIEQENGKFYLVLPGKANKIPAQNCMNKQLRQILGLEAFKLTLGPPARINEYEVRYPINLQ